MKSELELDIGSEVYWDDPDGGLCSGYYIVKRIVSDTILVLTDESYTSEVEVFIHELS